MTFKQKVPSFRQSVHRFQCQVCEQQEAELAEDWGSKDYSLVFKNIAMAQGHTWPTGDLAVNTYEDYVYYIHK